MLNTTARLACNAGPCRKGYSKVGEFVGGILSYGRDTPIPLSLVLKTAGLESALWATRCVIPGEEPERNRIVTLFACDCVRHVLPLYELVYPEDSRPQDLIEAAQRLIFGEITVKDFRDFYHGFPTAVNRMTWFSHIDNRAAAHVAMAVDSLAWVALFARTATEECGPGHAAHSSKWAIQATLLAARAFYLAGAGDDPDDTAGVGYDAMVFEQQWQAEWFRAYLNREV